MTADSQEENNKTNHRSTVQLKGDTVEVIRGLLDQAEHCVRSAKSLLTHVILEEEAGHLTTVPLEMRQTGSPSQIVEGVFDGVQMIGSDSRRYPVPPNYASKSKLVAGDVLKMTIGADGAFIFKQIGPTERKKMIGILEEERGRFHVTTQGKRYQVLPASISYYQAKPGDRITIIVPRSHPAEWAAVENLSPFSEDHDSLLHK